MIFPVHFPDGNRDKEGEKKREKLPSGQGDGQFHRATPCETAEKSPAFTRQSITL
jgi:hypothetical protein